MVDYTKYVLKNKEELEDLLAGKDNLFVVACNKCFKEFDTTEEPELGAFSVNTLTTFHTTVQLAQCDDGDVQFFG